jgi:hypothetical protein
MEKPSLEIGNSNWAIKEGELLGYNRAGNDYLPIPITMTRASLGTRVNPEGLVEDVELLGGEEIDCGDFSCATPSTYWTEVGNSSLVVGDYQGRTSVANINISGTANSDRIIQDFDYVSGVTYFISVDVYLVSGNFRVDTSNSFVPYDFINTSTTGSWQTLTANFTATSTGTYQIWLRSSQQIAQFYVSNVSVKEVTKNNLARVDYDGTASSLLVEPQRTNLIPYSEDFSVWSGLIALSIGLNQGVSPNGLTEANLLSVGIDISATRHRLYNLYSFVSGDTYTYSLFAKKDEQDWFQLMFSSTAFDAQSYANFDLNNGVVGNTGTSTTANIIDYGSGWYKCSITCTATASVSTTYEVLTTNNTDSGRYPSYQSTTAVNVCYLWGAQLEVGSYATSYIPNFGTSSGVTRVQDQYSKTGISDLINSEEGVLFVEMAALSDDLTFRTISLSDNTSSNRCVLRYGGTTNYINVLILSGGSTVFDNNYTLSEITDFNKIAVKWKVNDFALWVDGFERATAAVGSAPIGLSQLQLSNYDNSGNEFYGKVKQLQVFKTALTDDELTILTGTSGVHFFPSYGSMASALTYTIE